MKKLIFIFLLVIPFCKAADSDQSWHQAVQNIPGWQQQQGLYLNDYQIGAIPAHLNLPQLVEIWLNNNRIGAIPADLNLPQLLGLHLGNNQIQAIPDNLNLPNLQRLKLENNYIDYVNPKIFNQFPLLNCLELNKNPLTQENVNELRAAAHQANRGITIIADDIGPQYAYAGSIKPAKKS